MQIKTLSAPVAALSGSLLLLASAVAGAAGYSAPCDSKAADENAKAPLSISVVELTDEARSSLREARADVDDAASNAPPLFLGPRIESMVQDIFPEDDAESLDEDASDTASKPDMAPLAETRGYPDFADRDAESDSAEDAALTEELYSPLRIYREMYRTDI